MIKVYGGWPTRSFRVQWLLEEMGVPYELRPVDLRRRAEDEAFMALNPAGFLPVLEDGETVMIESVAIMEYLIARHGPTSLAPGPDEAAFPAYQQFLLLGEAGLAAYLNVLVGSRFFAPESERENWGAKFAERLFFSRLDLVTRRLAEAPHLAGEAFTAADISVMYALDMGARLGLADRYGDTVSAYHARLAERDAYKKTVSVSPPPPGRR
jgi:glutathione S-transferase